MIAAHLGVPGLLLDDSGRVLHVFGEQPLLGLARQSTEVGVAVAALWDEPFAGQVVAGLQAARVEQKMVERWVCTHTRQGDLSVIAKLRFVPVPGRGNRFLLTVSEERPEEAKAVLPPCQSLIDALPDPVVVLDDSDRVLAVNSALDAWLVEWGSGSPCESGSRPDYLRLFERHLGSGLRTAIRETLVTGRLHSGQYRWRRAAGDLVLQVSVRRVELGPAASVLVSFRDTEVDTSSSERLQWASNVFDNSLDAILTLSPRGHVLLCNPAASRMLGRSSEELRGSSFLRLLSPAFLAARQRRLLRVLFSRQVYRGELSVADHRGKVTALWVAVNAVRNDSGDVTQWVVIASDISRLKHTQGRLQQMAFYDSLTGLPNRRLATEHIKAALRRSRRHGTTMSVLFFDLDGFKAINDSFGHDQGDVLLRMVGERLGQQLRSCDLLARLGGDEFVVVVEEAHDERAVHGVAQKLIGALSLPFQLGKHSVRCGTSVGVSTYPNCGADAQTLLRRADLAMYRAKRRGGGSVEYYHSFMEETVGDRFNSGRALTSAFDRGDFCLFFQPIQEVYSRRVLGVEALLRLRDRGRWLRPAEFLHLAQAGGLMPQIGEWVLRAACARLGRLSHSGYVDLCMCVNLSDAELAWPPLAQVIAASLHRERLAAERLVIEVPAALLRREPALSVRYLSTLSGIGVRTAADGFAGCGELVAQLRSLGGIDILKVEQSLLQHVVRQAASAPTCTLSGDLRLASAEPRRQVRVVAKGVELSTHTEIAARFGCDAMQGNFLAKPMDGSDLDRFLTAVPAEGCPP